MGERPQERGSVLQVPFRLTPHQDIGSDDILAG